jgi:aminoglycoside phosphotransferase (APT) family kinase protein
MDVFLLDHQGGAFPEPPGRDEVVALCASLLPEGIEAASVRELRGGGFNTTLLVECSRGLRRHVLRISPRHLDPSLLSNEAGLLRREADLGRSLAPVLGSLLPAVVATNFAEEFVARDAIVTDFAEGENWDASGGVFTAPEHEAVWGELAAIVRRIHDVTGTEFGWPGTASRFDSWSAFVLHVARGLLLDHSRAGIADLEAREWLKAVEDGRILLDEMVRVPRLLHGDLRPKNVLVLRDPGGGTRIVGLLGHKRGLWGDPMAEAAFHAIGFPAAFWECYGPRPDGPAPEFRADVYHGLCLVQRVLDARRRRRQDDFEARRALAAIAQGMRRIIVEQGLS